MAQAFEFMLVSDPNFIANLTAADAAGWEVIGYAMDSSRSPAFSVALLRRRIEA